MCRARRAKKLNLEKFLIFNQQFVTLIRAGLPILKGLDLLAERLTDPKLGPYIKAVRDEVRNGTLLSEAFRAAGYFPEDVRHFGHGRRKRAAAWWKCSTAISAISASPLAVPEESDGLADVSVRADRAGGPCSMVFLVTYVVPDVRRPYMARCRRNLPP